MTYREKEAIRKKIDESGFKVYIINELNTGTGYTDLEADLRAEGGKLTATDLHKYHTTMSKYKESTQVKPLGANEATNEAENNDLGANKDVLAVIEAIKQCNDVSYLDTLKMLHSLFIRQIAIVHNLQSDYLADELVLINNELSNLATIKTIYFDTLKLPAIKPTVNFGGKDENEGVLTFW